MNSLVKKSIIFLKVVKGVIGEAPPFNMEIEKFLEILKKTNDDYQNALEFKYKKNNGVYYTGIELAISIIENLFEFKKINQIWKLKFLEPAVGIGNFVFAYLVYISKNYKLTNEQIVELYSNLYVCDNDQNALNIYIELLKKSSSFLFDLELSSDFIPKIGNALTYDLNASEVNYKNITDYFGETKFDIIVTNPPYKSLRAETKHYLNKDEYNKSKDKYQQIKKDAVKRYKYSDRTNANIYKFFVEEILEHYSKDDALIALLIPGSFLTDVSSSALRKYILDQYQIFKIGVINENNSFVEANQSLCYLTINKKDKTQLIDVIKNPITKDERYRLAYKDISKRANYEIILLEKNEMELLRIIEDIPKVKDFEFIKVLRGELDLTLNKKYIKGFPTKYPLVKGRNIKEFGTINCDFTEFVDESFVKLKNKSNYIHSPRIACQQISNINKDKRLVFMEIPKNYVLGNSCNFILVEKNSFGINLDFLLGLFNSSVYNWYFKLFSSNNHINNYELKELPLPLKNKDNIEKILKLTRKLKKENSNVIRGELDQAVLDLIHSQKEINTNRHSKYEENADKFIRDVETGINERNKKLLKKELLNNHIYKLSDLDLEIIQSVPPGGNWTNIPQFIMNKSKRLLGIQKSGGRTTLYGRLEYEKPSYTITTYFNRPGNGCNIHPVENRVLTTREAARLQGFSDDYFFFGNQKDILNQIGNAVPPQIGYLFGQKLIENLNIEKSLDLFSGAGGLATGIMLSGINAVIANDIDYSASVTFKINHPEVKVICDDITKSYVKDKLISLGKEAGVELICGGPPCQGFSLAGFRKDNDERNHLFMDFVEVVKKLKPKAFIFENVPGLLSYKQGKTFLEIQEFFEQVGYNLQAQLLNFVEYGVPQKRKRVIIVGIRTDLKIDPLEIFPEKITKDEYITVSDAIRDLVEDVSEKEKSQYLRMIKKEITITEYYDFLKTVRR